MTSPAATKSSSHHVSWAPKEATEPSSHFIYDDDETDDGYSYDDDETLDTYYTGMTSAGIQSSPGYYDIDLCRGDASASVMSTASHGGRSVTSAPADIGKTNFKQDPILQWLDYLVGEERLRELEEDYEKLYSLLTQCWSPIMGEADAKPSTKAEV